MNHIKLTLQYDGTRYLGWTRPEKDHYDKTVAFRVVSTLSKLLNEEIHLFAGAKTETGVHALCQVVNFQTSRSLNPSELLRDLNKFLPKDIRILTADFVPERFRADLNARSKTYLYRLCTAPVQDPFTAAYSGHLYSGNRELLTHSPLFSAAASTENKLDLSAIHEAADHFLGTHDFRYFTGVKKKKGTTKQILDISLSESPSFVDISITANDFLYQMPSRMIAVLLETGLQLRTPDSIEDILNGTKKAEALCDHAGLLLKSINY